MTTERTPIVLPVKREPIEPIDSSRPGGQVERISVVLPVYNEQLNIEACLRGLWKSLAAHEHEILVCYDFDEDQTLPAIAAMKDSPPSVRLVKNTLGRGAANALRAGFAAATGDVIVTTMADLSDPPELIPVMAEKLRREKAAVVSGSRYVKGGSQTGGPLFKRFLSQSASLTLNWITGLSTHDATSNFRAYSREFIDTVRIESVQGFEIALELTVKAHLQGKKVAEVPSTWMDRTAGESRFRIWKWAPNYLRWYLRAMAAPATALLVLAVLLVSGIMRAVHLGGGALLSVAAVVALGALAAGALALARSLRGRNTFADVVHPLLWLLPWHVSSIGPVSVAALALSSSAWIAFTCGPGRLKAWASARWRGVVPHLNQSTLGIALAGVLLWLARMLLPQEIVASGLDPSWIHGLGHAMTESWRAGVDYVFTAGPLGCLASGAYEPALFPAKLWLWEHGFKVLVVVFLVLATLRCRSALDRALLFVLLFVLPIDGDPYAFVAMAAVSACVIDRPERIGLLFLAMVVLAGLSLVKFTFFVLAVPCALGIACVYGRRNSLAAAAGALLLFCGCLLAIWFSTGQTLGNIVPYLRTSLAISSAYSEAESLHGPDGVLLVGVLSLILCVALIALQISARPLRFSVMVLGAVQLFALFVAFKSGFVRARDHTPAYFCFVAVVPFMISPGIDGALRGAIAIAARLACAVLAVFGLCITQGSNAYAPAGLVQQATGRVTENVIHLLDLDGMKQSCERALHVQEILWDLPRTREAVGRETIDMISYEQGALFLNRLRWSPRPAFQSYVTFTPELLKANADFFESERAPAFVLFRLQTIDERLPTMDDGEALKVLARDYQPVLVEREYLLMRHVPRKTAKQAPGLEFEKTVVFGEEVDLRGLQGDCHVLSLDIQSNLWGKLALVLYKLPHIFMEIVTRDGQKCSYRVIPGMMRTGAIIDPLMRNDADWTAWVTGKPLPRLATLRILHPTVPALYGATMKLQIWRADDVAPIPDPEACKRLEFSMFEMVPTDVKTLFPLSRNTLDGADVLVVHAPSELKFEVAAGKHVLKGTYGLVPASYLENATDGASFEVVLVNAAGVRTPLFDRLLRPVEEEKDRGTQSMQVEFEAQSAGKLVFTTGPGPQRNGACDWAFWGALAVADVGPK